MAERDELTKIAYEMQAYREQAQLIQQQMANLQLNYNSVESAIETLNNIRKFSSKEEALLPIGSGAYIKARVESTEVALIDVGAGVIVEKPIPEAVQFLNSRMKDMDSLREKLQTNFEDVSRRMKGLEESANKLMEKIKTGSAPPPKSKDAEEEYR